MGTMKQEDFTSNFFTLFKETFEGPPPQTASCYLDQGGGLLQSLENISAADASRSVRPDAPTIAGHCEHVRFYVDVLHRFMHESLGKIDWKQSWLVRTVNDAEWDALRNELRREYAAVTEELQKAEDWTDTPLGEALAILTHTAYHLGAIRQLVRMMA